MNTDSLPIDALVLLDHALSTFDIQEVVCKAPFEDSDIDRGCLWRDHSRIDDRRKGKTKRPTIVKLTWTLKVADDHFLEWREDESRWIEFFWSEKKTSWQRGYVGPNSE